MLLQSDKLDYKHGEVVEFQIYNQVYNKIGLPNYRNIRCHGHLASSVANNGKVFCVMGEKTYRVSTKDLIGRSKKSLVGTMTPPAGYTLKPIEYMQNVKGVSYYGGNVSGGKIPSSPEDRERYAINPSNSDLDAAIQKQKDLIMGKVIG